MGKNKDKQTLKRKSDIPLETLPDQKDDSQPEKESPMGDVSVSPESSPEKLKKKQKRNKLSEEQAEDDGSKDQDTEDHQEHVRLKKKKKKKKQNEAEGTNDDDIERTVITEEPPRKKKKKEKTKEVNETEELETQSEGQSEESQTKRKRKKKKFRESEEDITEMRQEEEDVDTVEESETRGSEEKAKKKKAKVSKEDITENRHEEEDVDTAEESETQGSEEKLKKKKFKESEEDITEKRQEEEDNSVAEESESQGSEKKVKKKKAKVSKEDITEKRQEVEDVNTAEESESQGSKEQPKKKKKKLKDKDQDVQSALDTQETQTSPKRIIKDETEEDLVARKNESVAIDASLLNQLKEFIPDVESKEPVNVSKMIKYDLPRFKEFKKQGISLNLGRFTAQENERLKKNVEDFMALTAVDSATKLFFTCRYKQDQESIKKLKGTHKFFERIAEGIPRSCYYVYARGRRMFDDQNYQGEFTKEELCKLNKLHTLHGNNWKKISELMGRSALALQKRYKQLANKEGAWSKKEVQRLLTAVRDHIVSQIPGGANNNGSIRVLKETLYKRLPWQQIAMKVKTRSWSQCREKWMGILAVKMSFGTVCTEKKSLDIQVKLIKGMYEMEVDDAAHVNWEDLTALIGDVPPAYMQRRWHKMKVCYVPEWQKKSFADIIDFLHEKVLPQLEQKQTSYKDLEETQHKENEESYLLSDIFEDISKNEDVDKEGDKEDDEEEEENDNEGNKQKEAQ